jgi:ribosomal protein L35AE/L33A
MSEEQKPSVARMVHYQNTADGRCMAAVITQVYADTGSVRLVVFPPMAHAFNEDSVDQGTKHEANTWHWPERI